MSKRKATDDLSPAAKTAKGPVTELEKREAAIYAATPLAQVLVTLVALYDQREPGYAVEGREGLLHGVETADGVAVQRPAQYNNTNHWWARLYAPSTRLFLTNTTDKELSVYVDVDRTARTYGQVVVDAHSTWLSAFENTNPGFQWSIVYWVSYASHGGRCPLNSDSDKSSASDSDDEECSCARLGVSVIKSTLREAARVSVRPLYNV